ncbi:MAG: FAD-binding protein, partial [Rhodospirillaceae bacterium]
IGGMVAADVHGKNHHRAGSFGDHVEGIVMALADGALIRCSKTENPDLFVATKGGMGLTGVILSVTFRLMRISSRLIRQRTLRARNLREAMFLSEEHAGWTYLVAWLDCLAQGDNLGRSLLYSGEHATADELTACTPGLGVKTRPRPVRRIPLDFPAFAVNSVSVGAFNACYYRSARVGSAFVDYDTFFYPLDSILEWNRIYGRAGFVQYQCVLPRAASLAGMTLLLERIARAANGSFLAVLKLLGPSAGLMSFPMEGYTLALDFRADAHTFALLTELDAVVADHGGRLYLAKDARAGPEMLQGYPGLARFQAIRRTHDPSGKFSSVQSQRLGL